MDISFKLPVFEGPLDLLLHLLQEAEVAIEDIPIVEITDQYLAYIRTLHELHLDVATEFLVMASQLLAMKSRKLLPQIPVSDYSDEEIWEEEIDPQEALIQKLLEYRKIKAAAELLGEKRQIRSQVFGREPLDLSEFLPDTPINPVAGVSLLDLVRSFHHVLERNAYEEPEVHVERDEVSITERSLQIEDLLLFHGNFWFSELLQRYRKRRDLVVTFLALLELIKSRRVRCTQNELFADILLEIVRSE